MPQPFKMRKSVRLNELDGQFPDHVWVFAANPKASTLSAVAALYQTAARIEDGQTPPEDEQSERAERYYAAVSDLVLDASISGFDFSTPEAARAAFETADDPDLLYAVVLQYVLSFNKQRDETRKKAGDPLSDTATT